jgi:hypothetical protein
MIRQVKSEISYFWEKQKAKEFELKDLKIERDFNKDIFELFHELNDNVEKIRYYCDSNAESDENLFEDTIEVLKKYNIDTIPIENIPYYENPLINKN